MRARLAALFAFVVGLFVVLTPSSARAATHVTWIAQVPVAPTSSDVVHVWIDSDTVFGESVGVETLIGGTYTKHLGTYDTSFGGADWRVDIPTEPDGTTVSYQLFVRNTSGSDYDFTGFLWTYTVMDLEAGVDASADADAADVLDDTPDDTTDDGTDAAGDAALDDTAVVDTSLADSVSDVVSSADGTALDTAAADTFETGGFHDAVAPPDTTTTEAGVDGAVTDSTTRDSAIDASPHETLDDVGSDTNEKPDASHGFDATIADSGSNASGGDSSGGCGCELPGDANHREFPLFSLALGVALIGLRRSGRAR